MCMCICDLEISTMVDWMEPQLVVAVDDDNWPLAGYWWVGCFAVFGMGLGKKTGNSSSTAASSHCSLCMAGWHCWRCQAWWCRLASIRHCCLVGYSLAGQVAVGMKRHEHASLTSHTNQWRRAWR